MANQSGTNANTPKPKLPWQQWVDDILSIGTGEKSPTVGMTIDNIPELQKALLVVVGVALTGWLLVKLILYGIARASEKQAA